MLQAKTKTETSQMLSDGEVSTIPSGEEVFVDWTSPQAEENICQCYWNGEIIYLMFAELKIDLPSLS